MSNAIILENFGPIQNLKYQKYTNNILQKNEIRIKHTAIGVNFLDIYHRTGNHFNNISLPGIIGVEGVGIIEDKHSSVRGFNIGEKIGYPLNTGAYSTHRNINTDSCVNIISKADDKIIAASLMKGLTVSHMLFDVIKIKKNDTILWHAAAGGVGLIGCQWAKNLGATVIGTVGSEEKVTIAMEYGCDHVINYSNENISERVKEITNGEYCDAVIDGVGKFTWIESLKSVKPYGICISFGLASGQLPSFGFDQMPSESFITRATVGSVVNDKKSFRINSERYFSAIDNKVINPRIDSIIPLKDAYKAHEILEGRKNIGSIVLVP